MDVKELRVGNIVLKNGLVVTVDGRTIFDLYGFESHGIETEIYQPIRINEGWLLRCRKTDKGLLIQDNNYPDGDLYIDFNDQGTQCYLYNCSDGYRFGIEIKYVHQLQNIYFALTGEELTIK